MKDQRGGFRLIEDAEDEGKYVIPASRVDNGLRGHSRIVRELVLLLFWPLLIPYKLTVILSSTVPRIASSPWTTPSLLFLEGTPAIATHLSFKTPTSPALCDILRADDTYPFANR